MAAPKSKVRPSTAENFDSCRLTQFCGTEQRQTSTTWLCCHLACTRSKRRRGPFQIREKTYPHFCSCPLPCWCWQSVRNRSNEMVNMFHLVQCLCNFIILSWSRLITFYSSPWTRFYISFCTLNFQMCILILASPLDFQMAFILFLTIFWREKYCCESILLRKMKKQRYSLCLWILCLDKNKAALGEGWFTGPFQGPRHFCEWSLHVI